MRKENDRMEIMHKILIERECARLVTQYCHYVDHDEAAKIADLFTEDGVWKSAQFTMIGRHQIRKGFQKRQDNKGRMSRHVCNNLLIDVISETEAIGTVYLILYFHDGDPGRTSSPTDSLQKLGEYRDRFAKTKDGWRFARRESVANFLRKSG
jgi:hypothetical protein